MTGPAIPLSVFQRVAEPKAPRYVESPPPTVPERPAVEAEVPGPIRKLKAQAEAAGWEVRVTWARGFKMGTTQELDSLGMRATRGATVMMSWWVLGTTAKGAPSAKAQGAWVHRPRRRYAEPMPIAEWKAALAQSPDSMQAEPLPQAG